VGLAVALLRDRSGNVKIDLPVEGSLDDPSFRIVRVVLRAVGVVLQSAATAPFRLLGNLVPGGGADDAVRENFAPGQSVLSDTQVQSLRDVANALLERPGLRALIQAGVDAETDRAALLRSAREEALRQLVWEHLGSAGTPAPGFAPTARQREAALLRWLAATDPGAGRGPPADRRVAEEAFTRGIELSAEALADLARARGDAVRSVLVEAGVSGERIRVVLTGPDTAAARAEIRLE
jgi:hypothetical protein